MVACNFLLYYILTVYGIYSCSPQLLVSIWCHSELIGGKSLILYLLSKDIIDISCSVFISINQDLIIRSIRSKLLIVQGIQCLGMTQL